MLEDNLHLHIMNTTLNNTGRRNSKTGYLMMAKSALSPFIKMPEVKAILNTLAEIYAQQERPSVENLRQQLLALRATDPVTLYMEPTQPVEVLRAGGGPNPYVTPVTVVTPDLIRMINFALAELEKGWPQQAAVAQPHEEKEEERDRDTCNCSLNSIVNTIRSFLWASPQTQNEQNNANDNNANITSRGPGKSKSE